MAAPSPHAKRVKIVSENYKSVQLLAQHSKKENFNPSKEKFRPHFEGLNAILEAFEQDKTMTPEFKQSCQIDKLLRLICSDARYHFPQQYVERAKALNDHFEAMNWGALAEIADEDLTLTKVTRAVLILPVLLSAHPSVAGCRSLGPNMSKPPVMAG